MIAEQLVFFADSPANVIKLEAERMDVVARDHRPPEQVLPPCSAPADRCAVSPLGRHQLVDLSTLHYLPSRFCSWCGREMP